MDGGAQAKTKTQATPPPWIRGAVREVLERTPNYGTLSADDRQSLARAMVHVSTLAADLIAEESHADNEIAHRQPLARAQDQPDFATAADRVAQTTKNILNAVSFPRFVTDLINGVFKAMLDSNAQQMQQYVQLLGAVSASAEGFESTQFGLSQVRQWVADHFPESIEYDKPDPADGPPDPEEVANIKLRLKGGASMPKVEGIRATLGIGPEESVDASNPEQLVPLARRYLARQRQQMLATMIMMGMQRIVIDSGRINAAMRFHIDTRSAASEDKGSQFNLQNRVKASGSFGVGPWGASAEVENNIGYVSTEKTQTTEQMNTDLDLTSSVELVFRSDYLPLNQMAAQAQADRIRNASINPTADIPDQSAARNARLQAQLQSERERSSGIDSAISAANKPTAPAPTPAPAPGTTPTTGTTAPGTGAKTPATPGTTTPTTPTKPGTAPPPTPAPGTTAPTAPGTAQPTTPTTGTTNPAPAPAPRPATPTTPAPAPTTPAPAPTPQPAPTTAQPAPAPQPNAPVANAPAPNPAPTQQR